MADSSPRSPLKRWRGSVKAEMDVDLETVVYRFKRNKTCNPQAKFTPGKDYLDKIDPERLAIWDKYDDRWAPDSRPKPKAGEILSPEEQLRKEFWRKPKDCQPTCPSCASSPLRKDQKPEKLPIGEDEEDLVPCGCRFTDSMVEQYMMDMHAKDREVDLSEEGFKSLGRPRRNLLMRVLEKFWGLFRVDFLFSRTDAILGMIAFHPDINDVLEINFKDNRAGKQAKEKYEGYVADLAKRGLLVGKVGEGGDE